MRAKRGYKHTHKYTCDQCGKGLTDEVGVYIYRHLDRDHHFCPATKSSCMSKWIKEHLRNG